MGQASSLAFAAECQRVLNRNDKLEAYPTLNQQPTWQGEKVADRPDGGFPVYVAYNYFTALPDRGTQRATRWANTHRSPITHRRFFTFDWLNVRPQTSGIAASRIPSRRAHLYEYDTRHPRAQEC